MSRTIKDLDIGTQIYIPETVNDKTTAKEYFILYKDAVSTVILRKLGAISYQMNSTNDAVYDGCKADTYLNDADTGFLARFSNEVKSCFVGRSIDTFKWGDTEVSYITRKCYLLSEYELTGSGNALNAGIQYVGSVWMNKDKDKSQYVCMDDDKYQAVNWWLRNPGSASQFRVVNVSGSMNSNSASVNFWLRPALSVSNDTIVSDEGADIINLLPSTTKNYYELDVTGIVGETETRPVAARVAVDSSNLYDIKLSVSNNAKDTTPVWVDATAGMEVALENKTKTTEKWEIGVKLYGKTATKGYFNEPVVIVRTE